MLKYVRLTGTHYEIGRGLGTFGASIVHSRLLKTSAWASVMNWKSSARVTAMAAMVQQRHPQYWQELQGLADGLELPIDDVFLWNCRGDVWAMAPDGCTTVQLPTNLAAGRAFPSFAHNEDGLPCLADSCAMAEVTVDGCPGFSSFVYPGSLPGHTFGVNNAGLAMTVNNLRTLHAQPGLPRMVIGRALLDMPDLDQAIMYLRSAPRAGGFHFTIGQSGQTKLYGIEFNSALCSIIELDAPCVHSNHMIHHKMAHQPQIITGSSGYRQIQGTHLMQEADALTAHDLFLKVLFDKSNHSFPLFRDSPLDSDDENTLATAILEISGHQVNWKVFEQRSTVPSYTFTNGRKSSTA